MPSFTNMPVTRYDHGRVLSEEEMVAEEYTLTLHVNDMHVNTFTCTPRDLNCLVVGFLMSEGVVGGADEIKMLSVNDQRGIASAWLRESEAIAEPPEKIRRRLPPDMQSVLDRMMEFNGRFEQSPPAPVGNMHGAALCTNRELLLFHEDICPLNAIDKLIGDAALQGIDMREAMLLTSGQMSSDTLQRAIISRVETVASCTMPTAQAITLAKEFGIALIGSIRGRKCNVYST